jgi:hypothetical protein
MFKGKLLACEPFETEGGAIMSFWLLRMKINDGQSGGILQIFERKEVLLLSCWHDTERSNSTEDLT